MRRSRKSHKIKGGRVNHPEHLSVNCNYVFISRISSTALTGKLGSFVGWKEGGKIYCSLRRANYERAEEKKRKWKGISMFKRSRRVPRVSSHLEEQVAEHQGSRKACCSRTLLILLLTHISYVLTLRCSCHGIKQHLLITS